MKGTKIVSLGRLQLLLLIIVAVRELKRSPFKLLTCCLCFGSSVMMSD